MSVFAATEPDAGCDLHRVTTRLDYDGKQFRLTGTKMFITGATYGRLVKLLAVSEGKPVIVECPEHQNFKIKPEQLEKNITPKTKWLMLNSPSNPTGAVYSKEELKDILVSEASFNEDGSAVFITSPIVHK